VGSVGTAPWRDVARVGVVLGVAGVLLLAVRRPLATLALDDDSARSIGSRPVATRAGAIILSSLLAAVAVAVAGPIAFVAFVSGPIARRLRGRGPALATAALVGGVVVAAADLIAQHLIPGTLQPPVGLVTGALGSPFLIWLLVRGERRKESAA
jgi:iron complex transport system permease protein